MIKDDVLYRKQIKNEIAKEILKESYQKYPYLNYTFLMVNKHMDI
ncbi:MAG: hypothetical protein ACLR43_03455 [Faecalibacillus faecis]